MAYYSEKMNGAKLHYNTYNVEFYATVLALKCWYHYLIHNYFVLHSDHEALKYLNSQDKLSDRHAKWVAYVQQFSFRIKHKSGVLNRVTNIIALVYGFY